MDLLQLLREKIVDPKTRQRKRYQTSDIIFLAVLAIAMGATNIKEVALWIKQNIKTKLIKDLLGVRFTLVPSNATVHRRLSSVDTTDMSIVFKTWYEFSFKKEIDIPDLDNLPNGMNNCVGVLLEMMESSDLIHTNQFMVGNSIHSLQNDQDEENSKIFSVFSKVNIA
jgi:hypothetical protein